MGGQRQAVPSEDYSRRPPHWQVPLAPALFRCRAKKPETLKKTMNTNNNNNIAAPSVTIAPRNPSKGVLVFVVPLPPHKDVQSYPCRTMEKATQLATRFVAGITKAAQ